MKKMKKIVCYAFGIIGILAGATLIYCVLTGEKNQNIYLLGSVELFVSTTIFLLLIKNIEKHENLS